MSNSFEMVLENQVNIYIAEVRAIAEANNAIALVKVDEEYANLIREIDPSYVNGTTKSASI